MNARFDLAGCDRRGAAMIAIEHDVNLQELAAKWTVSEDDLSKAIVLSRSAMTIKEVGPPGAVRRELLAIADAGMGLIKLINSASESALFTLS